MMYDEIEHTEHRRPGAEPPRPVAWSGRPPAEAPPPPTPDRRSGG
jgi:hypothetical protein